MLENYKNTWTEAEIEQLLLLKESKKTHAQIAEILGRTKASIDVKYSKVRNDLKEASRIWTHEETETLIALAETLPFSQLVIRYNQLAVKKGYQERTILSVQNKLLNLGQSLRPNSGWYGATAVIIGLGFSRERIRGWINSGLKHHSEGSKRFYIRNDHLVEYILSHPNCLEGISNDGLRWFIALLNEEKEMKNHDGRPECARSLTA